MADQPDNMPDDLPHDMEEYVSYADELDEETSGKRKKKDGEGEGDSEGNQGSGDAARANMTAEEIIAEEEVKESWLEKLKLIFIAPFSHIIPGTVSYTAENELSKKAFFLRVGLYNRQIEPTDVADPDLIQKLEDRHQERRRRFGLGPSVPLEYEALQAKLNLTKPGMSAPGLGATATESGGETGSGGGGSGTQVKASATGTTEAAKEKTIFRRTSIEERELMAQGASIDEAKAEIDEYTTPEEAIQEQAQATAFAHVIMPSEAMELHEAFNFLAAQTQTGVQRVELDRSIFTDRDGKQERAPSFPIFEKK